LTGEAGLAHSPSGFLAPLGPEENLWAVQSSCRPVLERTQTTKITEWLSFLGQPQDSWGNGVAAFMLVIQQLVNWTNSSYLYC